jgi:AbrB family looped-hinge helix DNA binding protein
MKSMPTLTVSIPYYKVRNTKKVRIIMSTATVTSKGQITIPATVRTSLGIETGSRIEFVEMENGQFMIVPIVSPIQSLKGMLSKPASPVSIEDMNRAIATQGAKLR